MSILLRMAGMGARRAVDLTLRRGGALEQHELALHAPSDADGALDRIVELLGVDGPGGEPVSVALALPDLIALIVAADAVQSSALRARLARSRADRPVLTAELMERELERALACDDDRWAGVGTRLVAPEPFAAARGRMAGCLAALDQAGLTSPVPRGHALTPVGLAFAAAFNETTATASIVVSTIVHSSKEPVARALVHASPAAVCASNWETDNRVELSRAGAAGMRAQLRALLSREPVVQAERRCTNPSCGKPVRQSKRFCTSCGTPCAP